MSTHTDLLQSCKELREACAALFRVISKQPNGEELMDAFEAEIESTCVRKGFGVRAQEAITRSEGK